LGHFQGAIWNTWGPIDESAKAAFGFTASNLKFFIQVPISLKKYF